MDEIAQPGACKRHAANTSLTAEGRDARRDGCLGRRQEQRLEAQCDFIGFERRHWHRFNGPAYSLASALGVIAGIAAYATPGIMLVAFIPMFCVATAYLHLNRADPDCGTTFSWATRAMGPYAGWIGGWAVIVTNIIVMPSLAAIAGEYSFQLFGYGHPSTLQVTVAGVAWIGIMTAICFIGIELSARSQRLLLAAELAILLIFAG